MKPPHTHYKNFDWIPRHRDPNLKGMVLQSGHGDARFLVTRGQLLDIAAECAKAAQGMPRPS
jgi:hypothetical protein